MTQLQVHLYRDSFTTPWGIRLQGGKDLTSPLLIQRVFPNTPAAGYLQRGDILLTLNGKDASGLTHKQAQDVFQFAGGQIPLVIRRANIESRNAPPPPKQQQHQQLYPPQVQPQQSKPQASSTVIKTRNRPKTSSTTMAPTLKSSNTPLRKSKIESTKSAKGKPKQKVLGGGGFSFGVDYSKVEIQEDYVPGPIYNEEEQADDLDQSYRTVPLDLEGPTKMAHPHIPKGGMKYGGGGPNYGVSYIPPGGVQRQSSKPWEDTEMLHKVQDTLAHKSFPYQQVGSYNGGPPAHYQHVAPPAYVPGPPPPTETSYVDPFPSYVPPKPSEDDEEDYEFLPVSQRRNQFNKQDFVPDTRKPIRSRGRPQTYHAPPPPPHTAPKPVIQPVYAPMSRPAEGEVIQDETPAWAGTLSSASGAKLRDATYQPTTHHVSPTRSVSPSKKKGRKPPAPKPTQEFTPTKTQALDFSNNPDDGPRIMHLQYNSPLDMYSRENVQETLQGQTQAALGGGNTAAPQKKVPAHERDWGQSELLRMIQANEEANEPKSPPQPPVQSTPRPRVSPPKKAAQPPPPPSPKPISVSPVPPAYLDTGVSDF